MTTLLWFAWPRHPKLAAVRRTVWQMVHVQQSVPDYCAECFSPAMSLTNVSQQNAIISQNEAVALFTKLDGIQVASNLIC